MDRLGRAGGCHASFGGSTRPFHEHLMAPPGRPQLTRKFNNSPTGQRLRLPVLNSKVSGLMGKKQLRLGSIIPDPQQAPCSMHVSIDAIRDVPTSSVASTCFTELYFIPHVTSLLAGPDMTMYITVLTSQLCTCVHPAILCQERQVFLTIRANSMLSLQDF